MCCIGESPSRRRERFRDDERFSRAGDYTSGDLRNLPQIRLTSMHLSKRNVDHLLLITPWRLHQLVQLETAEHGNDTHQLHRSHCGEGRFCMYIQCRACEQIDRQAIASMPAGSRRCKENVNLCNVIVPGGQGINTLDTKPTGT